MPAPRRNLGKGYFDRLASPTEPWDIAFTPWAADYVDPYSFLNLQFDGRFIGGTNYARFDSARYNRLLRQAARLQGGAARATGPVIESTTCSSGPSQGMPEPAALAASVAITARTATAQPTAVDRSNISNIGAGLTCVPPIRRCAGWVAPAA